MAFVNGEQLLQVDVGVFLGRGQAGVPEELLDGAQVGAAAEEVRGEGMAERVGADLLRATASPVDVLPDHPLDGPRRQPAARCSEKAAPPSPPAASTSLARRVILQGLAGLAAEQDDALLLAFAADADEALAEMDVGRFDADELVLTRMPEA